MTKLADELRDWHYNRTAWFRSAETHEDADDLIDAAIAALRQPDAVPGDLVAKIRAHMVVISDISQWSGMIAPDGPPFLTLVSQALAAIQSLTDQRNEALARVTEWRDHIIESGETFGLMAAVLHEFDAERFAQEIAVAELFSQSARALLEGSKP